MVRYRGEEDIPSPQELFSSRGHLFEQFPVFFDFFPPSRWSFLLSLVRLSLEEDGEDITSKGIFNPEDRMEAAVVVKEDAVVCASVLSDIIMAMLCRDYKVEYMVLEGEEVKSDTEILRIGGRALDVLKAERVILNFLTHTCGIATYTRKFVKLLKNTDTILLDTRKTLPGFRFLDKYSVRIGGAQNHRFTLDDMIMIKDNHIDRMGSIKRAIESIREKYKSPPPIIVECRNEREVREAVECGADRILLDNMSPSQIKKVLSLVPRHIETEISGGINLHNVLEYASLGAHYISVGAITKSAPAIDLSMKIMEK